MKRRTFLQILASAFLPSNIAKAKEAYDAASPLDLERASVLVDVTSSIRVWIGDVEIPVRSFSAWVSEDHNGMFSWEASFTVQEWLNARDEVSHDSVTKMLNIWKTVDVVPLAFSVRDCKRVTGEVYIRDVLLTNIETMLICEIDLVGTGSLKRIVG